MFELKINKKGQITVPKAIREKYGLTPDITLIIKDNDTKLSIEPAAFCRRCKKALVDGAECPSCPPLKRVEIY